MPFKLFLASFILSALSGCVTLQDATTCAASGELSDGGLCAHEISPMTCVLTPTEIIDFIEAHPQDRTCVEVCGLPVCAEDQSSGKPTVVKARGASIIMTPADFGEKLQELEEACRELGSRCSIQTVASIKSMKRMLAQ